MNHPIRTFASLLALAGLLQCGCDIPPRPILQPVKKKTDPSLRDKFDNGSEVLDAPAALVEPSWETWDAYFVGNKQVGYSHLTAAPAEQGDPSEIRYDLEDRIYFQRGRARILQRITQSSYESRDGQLLRCESQLQVGPAVTRFEGMMNESEFVVETIRGNYRTVRRIPWMISNRGLVAIEQSLRAKQMSTGDRRKIQMLVPRSYVLATATLRCSGNATVPLIDGKIATLIEIDCDIVDEEANKTRSTIWTDENGNIVRTYSPGLQLVGYRTDEATATNFGGNDLVSATIGISGKRIERPNETQKVAYLVTPIASDPTEPTMMRPAPGQYVRTRDDGTLQVLVSRVKEPLNGGFVDAPLEVSDGDLKQNHFIDHKTTLVKRLAKAAVSSSDMSKREIALALAETTSRSVTPSEQTSGFIKASEVARVGEGDSVSAAIMLAAMLRARRIPSRLAVGLKYTPSEEQQPNATARLVSHVWTLAHVDGDWLHLDPFIGGAAGADRIVFSTTNLSEENQYDSIRPLLEGIGDSQFEIVGAQY